MRRAIFNGSECMVCAACFTVGSSYAVEEEHHDDFKVVDDHDKFWWVKKSDPDFTIDER